MLTRFVSAYAHEFIHWHFIIPTIYGPGENVKRLIPYTIQSILKHSIDDKEALDKLFERKRFDIVMNLAA